MTTPDVAFQLKRSPDWNYLIHAELTFLAGENPEHTITLPKTREEAAAYVAGLRGRLEPLKYATTEKRNADKNHTPAPALSAQQKELFVRNMIEVYVAKRATDSEATFSTQQEMEIRRYADISQNVIILMERGEPDSEERDDTKYMASDYVDLVHNIVEKTINSAKTGHTTRANVPVFN
jgi:hypothetical protein